MSKKKVASKSDENEYGKWEGIPEELLALAVIRIPADEMMRVVPLVCKSWWAVVAGPLCWENIDLRQWSCRKTNSDQVDVAVRKLVRHSRSSFHHLSAFKLGNSGFAFAANRARCLKVLNMSESNVTDQMVIRHAESLANLTDLDISYCIKISWKGLEAFGKQCKFLVNLKRNMPPPNLGISIQEANLKIDESEAMVIANTMSKLQHLEIWFGCFSNLGLNYVLTKCKALEYLDIRGCWSVGWEEDLETKCEKIAGFKSPWVDDVYETEDSDVYETEDSEILTE
ncbi:F-box protein FBW2 [Heracleum sosnowskyi]|uniref:F-box protein FBW2 n=1 Tax=Heracleum sosnowskyi TaxID=360622 RepID=A0AAD8GQ57_9APIA|nr:F-box protein FBW2 [Heracleum sosnowskyi]